MQALQKEFSPNIVLVNNLADAAEFVAERNEQLLDKFMEEALTDEEIVHALQHHIKQQEAFIAMQGAALKSIGVMEFFNILHQLTTTTYEQYCPIRS